MVLRLTGFYVEKLLWVIYGFYFLLVLSKLLFGFIDLTLSAPFITPFFVLVIPININPTCPK